VLSAAAQSWVGGAGRRRDDVGTNPSPLVLPPPESTSDPRQLGLHWNASRSSGSSAFNGRPLTAMHDGTVSFNMNPRHVKSMISHSAQCLSSA